MSVHNLMLTLLAVEQNADMHTSIFSFYERNVFNQ